MIPLLWIGLLLQSPQGMQAPAIAAAVDADGLTSGCTYLAQHPDADHFAWSVDGSGQTCTSVWTGVVDVSRGLFASAYAPCCLPGR